jgi:Flp pilus assembly protein TadD
MTKPFSRLCSIPQRHLLPLTLLTCALTGCQSTGFSTALSGKKPDARTVSSTAAADSSQAGLPEPTNTASSNSPLSLSSTEEHLRLGEQELAAGNLQQAQMHFEHVLKKHPEHTKAHHRLGVLADKLGRFEQAEQHYLTALADDPRNAALLSDLGYSYFMQGRHKDAERYLLEARKADPQYDTAIANLGLLYGSTGRKQEALALFRRIGNDQQVQAIMQQIEGGEFGPAGKLAANTPASQQSSAVTLQSSVQQSANGSGRGLHHDPAMDFAQQLEKAREELRRAEEEFTRHQQSQQSQQSQQGQLAQAWAQQTPQQPEWAQQTPSSHHQQPQQQPSHQQQPYQQQQQQQPWQNQQMPAQHAQPGDAARFDALAGREQPYSAAGAGNPPATLGPQQVVGPLPEVTPAGRHRSSSHNNGPSQHPLSTDASTSASQGGESRNQPAGSFGSQQFASTGTRSQPQQAPLGESPWGQGSAQNGGAANAAAPSTQNSFTSAENSRNAVPAAAWGQQFANTIEQSGGQTGGQGTSNAPQSIQQLSGNAHSSGQQQPVEHAYHTQQQHAQNNITLAGQQGPASAGPLPQIGNQSGDAWSTGGQPSPQGTSPQSNSFEAARREAALLGLNAGPGQVFPYIQRYERARTDADPQYQGGQQQHGAQQHHGGQTSSGHVGGVTHSGQTFGGQVHGVTSSHASAAGAQQAPHWSQQQNGSQQNSPEQQQQPSPAQQQWQQQPTGRDHSHTSNQPSSQTGGEFTQTWGQQQQSQQSPYGVNPTTTTQHYGPTPTPAGPYSHPSHVTPTPYYERPNSGGHGGGVVTTGYESPQPPTSYAPQQASGGVVVPEAYHNRQSAPAGNYQQPPAQYQQQHQQYQQQQQLQHQQQYQPPQVQTNPRPYTGPMIVPGER